MWDWLWQGVASSAVWQILFVLGGIAVGVLKKRASLWISPVLYGICAFALLEGLFVLYNANLFFQSRVPFRSEAQVEKSVREWLDNFHISASKRSEEPPYFFLEVKFPNGDPANVVRAKELPNYLQLQAALTIAPEHFAVLNRMAKDQQGAFIYEVIVEASKIRLGVTTYGNPLQGIVLTKRLPITNGLTENTLISGLDDVDYGLIILRQFVIDKLAASPHRLK